MMRVLIVSPVPVDPVTAGNRAKIATMCSLFQRWGWEVHFAFVPMEAADLEAHPRRFGAGRFHVLQYRAPMPSWPARAFRKAARNLRLDAGYRWGLDDWFDDGLLPQLKALQQTNQFDMVFVEYVFMSRALTAFGDDVLKVLDTHDCFADRHRRYLEKGQTPQWYATSEQEETRGFLRAHAVLAIQSQEAKSFGERVARLQPADCTVLEFGHVLDEVKVVQPSDDAVGIFLGSDNPINTTALQWFTGQVMPLIRARAPSFRLKVVGSVCKGIADADGVDKLGFVDDLADAFSQARVNVNPIRMGTGVNIKLLDAMMYGMPCVSTTTGARGLEMYGGNGLAIVGDDDAQGFAEAVIRCLIDPEVRDGAAAAARSAALNWNARQQGAFQAWLQARQAGHAIQPTWVERA